MTQLVTFSTFGGNQKYTTSTIVMNHSYLLKLFFDNLLLFNFFF